VNLIDAIKSGKRFRRSSWHALRDWVRPISNMCLSIPVDDVIADDWELKQQIEDITISRKKYSDSWHRATIDLKIYDVSPSVLRTFRDFIARELGFENY